MPPNPKKLYGDKKPPLAELPLVAQAAASLAHYDGDLKYGFRNWRSQPVEVMTYVNAALRHLRLYEEGEEFARDTGVPNLGAVIACCAILLDAAVNDALIDNRSKSPGACDYLHDAEKIIERLKQAQIKREAEKAILVPAEPATQEVLVALPSLPEEGETIECVDASGVPLTKGKRYKVKEGTSLAWVRVMADHGVVSGFYPSRFRLVKTVPVDQYPDHNP